VYMSVKPSTYGFDDYGVVVVEAQAFLSLWRAEPHGIHAKDANGHPESWREHYKFAAAARGFLRGLSDPVPLAEVSCEVENNTTVRGLSQSYVYFSNGITRTIWLLANGCTAFPIHCPMPGARELQERAAVTGTELLMLPSAAGSHAA
jgi:phosphatidate phosphatase APP1